MTIFELLRYLTESQITRYEPYLTLYDIIILEPSMSFYVTCDCNIILIPNSKFKIEK